MATTLEKQYGVVNVKFAAIVATTGDTAVVAAVAGRKIRVLSAWGTSDIAGLVRWEDGAAGTALTGRANVGITGGYVLNEASTGHFETTAGVALSLELTTAGNFDGSLVYTLI